MYIYSEAPFGYLHDCVRMTSGTTIKIIIKKKKIQIKCFQFLKILIIKLSLHKFSCRYSKLVCFIMIYNINFVNNEKNSCNL